jgi:hypothetical protein
VKASIRSCRSAPSLECAERVNAPWARCADAMMPESAVRSIGPGVARGPRRRRNSTVTADRGRATLYGPLGSSSLIRSRPSGLLTVKIDRAVLENQLQEALRHEIAGRVAMAPSKVVSTGAGRSWAQLAGLLATNAADSGALTGKLDRADRLVESLIGGLLVAVDHPYREEMTRPERAWRPRPLQRASFGAPVPTPARSPSQIAEPVLVPSPRNSWQDTGDALIRAALRSSLGAILVPARSCHPVVVKWRRLDR